MTEAKQKKDSSNVRLPGDLLAELRKYQAPYLARGEEAPSFGDLLSQAWGTARAAESPDLDRASELWSRLGDNATVLLDMLADPKHPDTEILLKSIDSWKKEQLKLKKRDHAHGPREEAPAPRGVNDRRRGSA